MPLLRLELYNFKSYKGSQIVDFGDAPFMCIIGPNGAGKSNLMDAISFVLGVKSAQLRSIQLRDLIYRGRRAQAIDNEETLETLDDATNAYVTAVYADENGVEWNFKRSISNSGQSSYSLNGRETPYKNYNGQLEKFNVLVKAKNFLVFQGDVESVASQDSKHLAALIDRISGSADLASAYEKAKEDLDKATDASTSNYAKKRSMASEVKHFREQRDEVKQWEKLNREKDTATQRHFLWRLYHLTTEINDSSTRVEKANKRLKDLHSEVSTEEHNLRQAKKEAAQAQLQMKKIDTAVHKAEKALEDERPNLVSIDAQIAHSQRRAEESRRVAERVEKDLDRQTASLEQLEQDSADFQTLMEDAREKQRQKSASSGKTLTKEQIDQYHQLRATANAARVAERQQVEKLRRDRKTQLNAVASIDDKIQQAEARKDSLEKELEQLRQRNQVMQERYDDITAEREGIKSRLDAAQAERERINIKETELNEKLQDVYGKLLAAGADKRQSEREVKLQEALSGLKRVFPGVRGRLVDLCQPTSKKYERAVTTVLGRNLDAIVVDHEKVAIECIDFLRNQRAGQATFIPLDTIQVKPVQEKYRNFAKGARLAVDCLEYGADVERAIQHACGSSLICDSMTVARHVCYDKGQEVKAVTLEGTVIHKSGLITGGQGSNQRQFNDQDVTNLQKARDTYMNQLTDLNRAKPNADDVLLGSLSRLDAEITVVSDDMSAIQVRIGSLQAEIDNINKDLDRMAPDQRKKKEVLATTNDKLTALETALEAADNVVFAAFCSQIGINSIRDYEDVQSRMARDESEAMEKFSNQLARCKQQLAFETTQRVSTQERLASLRATTAKAEASLKQLSVAREEVQTRLTILQGALDAQREELAEARLALEKTTSKVDALRDSSRKSQRTLDRAIKEIAAWNDEIEQSASNRHAIYRRCRLEEIALPLSKGDLNKVPLDETSDVSMDIDDDGTQKPVQVNDFGIEPDFDILDDEEKENGGEEVGREIEAEITRMKTELERMVPNMKAMERLADVEAGLQDAEREAEDTRRESKTAKDKYLELRKKRCELFNKAYGHMSGCIDKIYKDLTKSTTFQTGGVAFLSLEDAEEPYLSGVKYNVMPPGKAFVDMEQLSGGEKTMAALALLFSIHSFHPAPFFVLDEVDAALDPTNVAKLARYVRSQAEKQVQFLIISLKATLYEHADGLVGVYREQEMNTSKVLTLDLRRYAE